MCGRFWSGVECGVECEVEGRNKEIKKKKVGAHVWRKLQGKRGNKEIKKKKMEGTCVVEKKRGKKKKEIWIKK